MNSPFQKVEGFEAPSPSNIIWRYMSLEKFLNMLERRTLRFSRASTMSDGRELRLPYEKLKAEYWQHWDSLNIEERRSSLDSVWENCEQVKAQAHDLRRRTYLSSWTIAQTESYALWKIYLGGSRAGVAIKSTFSALQKAIKHEREQKIQCARVRYTDDVNPEHLEDRHFIYQKSTHYDYEKELRLAIDHAFDPSRSDDKFIRFMASAGHDTNPNSLNLSIDTNTLIREIYLSPFAMKGFQKSFEKIVRKIDPDLQAHVCASEVRDS